MPKTIQALLGAPRRALGSTCQDERMHTLPRTMVLRMDFGVIQSRCTCHPAWLDMAGTVVAECFLMTLFKTSLILHADLGLAGLEIVSFSFCLDTTKQNSDPV